ncbi:hypothetical protein CcCBS67573_g07957 [Chytriomyces confervae]|uniref:ATPase AAA-type core domain-containing protein n=1 Tax=Chytriomyces confervae TaxID=246404 RepID=A0A507ES47_9FUNG|nr:hypothetical protein CcCBS67573_g07957 [Chytriomyces confervae]
MEKLGAKHESTDAGDGAVMAPKTKKGDKMKQSQSKSKSIRAFFQPKDPPVPLPSSGTEIQSEKEKENLNAPLQLQLDPIPQQCEIDSTELIESSTGTRMDMSPDFPSQPQTDVPPLVQTWDQQSSTPPDPPSQPLISNPTEVAQECADVVSETPASAKSVHPLFNRKTWTKPTTQKNSEDPETSQEPSQPKEVKKRKSKNTQSKAQVQIEASATSQMDKAVHQTVPDNPLTSDPFVPPTAKKRKRGKKAAIAETPVKNSNNVDIVLDSESGADASATGSVPLSLKASKPKNPLDKSRKITAGANKKEAPIATQGSAENALPAKQKADLDGEAQLEVTRRVPDTQMITEVQTGIVTKIADDQSSVLVSATIITRAEEHRSVQINVKSATDVEDKTNLEPEIAIDVTTVDEASSEVTLSQEKLGPLTEDFEACAVRLTSSITSIELDQKLPNNGAQKETEHNSLEAEGNPLNPPVPSNSDQPNARLETEIWEAPGLSMDASATAEVTMKSIELAIEPDCIVDETNRSANAVIDCANETKLAFLAQSDGDSLKPNVSVSEPPSCEVDLQVVHPFFKTKLKSGSSQSSLNASNGGNPANEDEPCEGRRRTSKRISVLTAEKAPNYYPILDLGESTSEDQKLIESKAATTSKTRKKAASCSSVTVTTEQKSLSLDPPVTTGPLTDEELLLANPFFLSMEQRRRQKTLQDLLLLQKEIEERHKLSADFSKGKSLNPFLKPRVPATSSLIASNTSNCIEKNFERPSWAENAHASWPTVFNSHVNHSNACFIETPFLSRVETPFKLKNPMRSSVQQFPPKVRLVNVKSNASCIDSANLSGKNFHSFLGGLESWTYAYEDCNRVPSELSLSTTLLLDYLLTIHKNDLVQPSPVLSKLFKSLSSPERKGRTISHQMWSDKFQPNSVEDLVGASTVSNARFLKDWLMRWKSGATSAGPSANLETVATGRKTKNRKFKKPKQDLDNFIVSDDVEESDIDIIAVDDIQDVEDDAEYFDLGMHYSEDEDEDIFEPIGASSRRNRRNRRKGRLDRDRDRGGTRPRKTYAGSSTETPETSVRDRHLRLIGPPASGRSCCIRAAALDCGYDVIEVNAGQKRSGKEVSSLLSEATQSHAVTLGAGEIASLSSGVEGEGSKSSAARALNVFSALFAPKAKKSAVPADVKDASSAKKPPSDAGLKKKRRLVIDDDEESPDAAAADTTEQLQQPQQQQSRPSLIVIEDADILFEQHDKGFWAAIWTIVESSKRPIIFVCNDDFAHMDNPNLSTTLVNNFLNSTIPLHFTQPSTTELHCYIHLLLLNEGYWMNSAAILELINQNGHDLRKCLNSAEIACRLAPAVQEASTVRIGDTNDEPHRIFAVRCQSVEAPRALTGSVSVAGRRFDTEKLKAINEMEEMAARFHQTSLFDKIGPLNCNSVYADAIDGASTQDATAVYPILSGLKTTSTCVTSQSLAAEIWGMCEPMCLDLAVTVPQYASKSRKTTLPASISIYPPHHTGVSQAFHQDYLPFVSEMCAADTEEEYNKRATSKPKPEAGAIDDILTVLTRMDSEEPEVDLRRTRRLVRKMNHNLPFRRHFEDLLTEDQAACCVRTL